MLGEAPENRRKMGSRERALMACKYSPLGTQEEGMMSTVASLPSVV
jgi:hypothetical protein